MCFLGFGLTCPVIPPVSLETFHIIVHHNPFGIVVGAVFCPNHRNIPFIYKKQL